MKKTFKLLLAGCLLTAGFAFSGDNYSDHNNNMMVTDTIIPVEEVPDTTGLMPDTTVTPIDTTQALPVTTEEVEE